MKKTFLALRPADALNIVFLVFLSVVTLLFHEKVRGAGLLLLIYSGLLMVQFLLIARKEKTGLFRMGYDLLFPVVSILVVYDSLEAIVHYINPRDVDPLLIRLDYMLLGCYPTVALERIMMPLLTDILQLAYTSYYFLPVALGIALKRSGDDHAFDRSLFLIMFCFYLSYLGYMLMPALGPRYTMNHLQDADLRGLLVTAPLQGLLNGMEGIKRDAFPSGHTGITLTVLYLAFRYEKRLFNVFLPVVSALIFATVYCRYHYVVDVIAGVLLALITIIIGEAYYGFRSERVGLNS